VISTSKETTLGSGASVPVTKTLPDCGVVVAVELVPPPHPESAASSRREKNPFAHFDGFMIIFPFRFWTKIPKGPLEPHLPWGD
jgi:hypothetical protein